jgi:hypothetical protein
LIEAQLDPQYIMFFPASVPLQLADMSPLEASRWQWDVAMFFLQMDCFPLLNAS